MARRSCHCSLGLLIVVALVTSTGCRSIRWPTLFQPGPTEYQRYNAIQHDPYQDTNAGPDGGGVRPREYQTPLNDSQRYPIRRGGAGPVAPAGW